MHQFSSDVAARLRLAARARQFSRWRTSSSQFHFNSREQKKKEYIIFHIKFGSRSFILMIGTILSADEFRPTHAVIIKDKDEVLIPLLLETMPSPKEVRSNKAAAPHFGCC